MEARGWPSMCDTAERITDFVNEVKEKKDILLDAANVDNNPGTKAVAKLKLNLFRGKSIQRANMTRTKFMHDPKKCYDMCRSEAVEIHNIYAGNPE